jgi:hypothetical protein
MISTAWSVIFLLMKIVLVGLIYWALFVLLRAVRREMALRIASADPAEAGFVPGRLRITHTGGDLASRLNEMIYLKIETSLGAETDNDVVLNDPFVSAHHARLRWDGAGWWLEDLGSRNGSYIFHARCQPFVPQPVPPGAALQLGGMQFSLLA